MSVQVRSEPEENGPQADDTTDLEPAPQALGLALGARAEACAQECQSRVQKHRWHGRYASSGYTASAYDTVLAANRLIARWLTTGEEASEEEALWLSNLGRDAATEGISIVNVTRLYLAWRDTCSDGLRKEARALGTPHGVLDLALGVVRASADAATMRMVAAYDGEAAKLQAQLAGSEHRFRAIFDRSALGMARLDLRGHLMEVNSALERMLGEPAQQLLGRSLTSFIVPEDLDDQLYTRLAKGELDSFQREFRLRSLSSGELWASMIVSLVRDELDGPAFGVGMVEDISGRKRQDEELAHQALHDALTGLPNRVLLHDRLEAAIRLAERRQTHAALLIMDLDGFKQVNDTFGHRAGDLVLTEVSVRLRDAVRNSDTVARLGGDEFAIVLPQVDELRGTTLAGNKVLAALESAFTVEGQRLHIGASIGIATYPDHGEDADTLMRCADIAMYLAKRSGGGLTVYSPEDDAYSPSRLALVTALRDGIQRGRLVMHYQPKVRLSDGSIGGFEALVRWRHPQLGLVQPNQFIPMAEQSGLIRQIGTWGLKAVVDQLRRWQRTGLDTLVSVNISAHQLKDPQLAEYLEGLLTEHSVKADALMLEVTESALMYDPDRSVEILRRIAKTGVKISIDDYGTGYSSLAYLQRLPAAELKIDGSFIAELGHSDKDAVIVRSTIELGHNLGLEVVAEGVETVEARRLLTEYGCDLAQGFLFAPALPPREAARQLAPSRGLATSP